MHVLKIAFLLIIAEQVSSVMCQLSEKKETEIIMLQEIKFKPCIKLWFSVKSSHHLREGALLLWPVS